MNRDRWGLAFLGGALGVSAGLLEGVSHMVIQHFGVLDNSWYPIIWIAAVFNGLVVGAAGLLASVVVRSRPDSRRIRAVAIFVLFLLAVTPVLTLSLKEWIYRYAIVLLIFGSAMALTQRYLRDESTWARRGSLALRWSVGAALLAFAAIAGGGWMHERVATARLPAAAASAPDVLLVVMDTVRSDHLASYGYSRPTSPAIDRWAAEGVLFENAFSTSSYTLPSHASILTGRYPRDHHVEWDTSHGPMDPAVPTLPQKMAPLGYRTGAFSANTFFFTREHGFGRDFLHFEDFFHSPSDMAWRTAYGGIATRILRPRVGWENLPARKMAPDVSAEAIRWIGRDAGRPFFAVVNYMDAHDPYLPPEPYRSRFAPAASPGGLINSKWHIPASLTADQLQGEIDGYDGAIAYIDDEVSRLVATIRAARAARPLVVIVTSDHGEEFLDHGAFLHQRHLYREVIQVPLIVWAPGLIPAGARLTQPVSNASIPATVMDLLSADATPFPVSSLRALWDGSRATVPPPLAELKHMPWQKQQHAPIQFGAMRSLVDASWHYIEQDGHGYQLFAWTTDRREAVNLADRPDLQSVIEQFQKLIK